MSYFLFDLLSWLPIDLIVQATSGVMWMCNVDSGYASKVITGDSRAEMKPATQWWILLASNVHSDLCSGLVERNAKFSSQLAGKLVNMR